ncbi:DNA-processing protein DprA [Bacillus sp. Bva_UNVM-123]|uniref:DNA-processing protein DprA n=1 Tax=Bacillus sp. Bva_UNVM-123 TaxID=2829798 RepID=UPI00391FBD87
MDTYWIWLSRVKYVGPVLQKELITHFQSPEAVYEAKEDELLEVPKITKNAIHSLIKSRSLKEAEVIQTRLDTIGVTLLPFNSGRYPNFAKESKESPIVLYYRGELQPFKTTVGVIGARRCSSYGKKIAEQLGHDLASLKIPVISGFAKGIDSYSQAACIRNGGYTISFLGCGPDVCYPNEQNQLYHQILECGGAFISQYPPGTPPMPKYFIARNALISAWSTELVIVEAGEQSGALTTADFAVKNNKSVYAVPNRIDAQEGVGTNRLLSQGIPPYLGVESLQSVKEKMKSNDRVASKSFSINAVPLLTPISSQAQKFTTIETAILQRLSENPKTIHQLFTHLNLTKTELMDYLFNLELEKQIIIRGDIVSKI